MNKWIAEQFKIQIGGPFCWYENWAHGNLSKHNIQGGQKKSLWIAIEEKYLGNSKKNLMESIYTYNHMLSRSESFVCNISRKKVMKLQKSWKFCRKSSYYKNAYNFNQIDLAK